MNPNPASDIFAFLTKPAWYTAAFWVLLIASAAIAAYVAARIPEQRNLRHTARWLFRLVIGALQIVNLWLGLYSAPNEWPWTYFFLIVLQLIFSFNHYGRSLGIDALLTARPPRSRVLRWVA